MLVSTIGLDLGLKVLPASFPGKVFVLVYEGVEVLVMGLRHAHEEKLIPVFSGPLG